MTTLRHLRALIPAVIVWISLAGWLAYELLARGERPGRADEANVREWLTESRVGSKTLADVTGEYLDRLDEARKFPDAPQSRHHADEKRDELALFLESLAVPTRMYATQLPLFPKVYRIEVRFPELEPRVDPVIWESHVPRSEAGEGGPIADLPPIPVARDGLTAELTCEYELHAYDRHAENAARQERDSLLAAGLFVSAALLAAVWVYRSWRREWKRELRVVRAERTAAEVRSQMFAGIGIMAGSYAHNIKNLLVRPNDLLDRLLETDGMTDQQRGRVREVRSTLDTVTERLQQILRTVRSTEESHLSRIDLNALLADLRSTWADIANEKWKLALETEPAGEPVHVEADLSHLQQAVENLLFNARDAVFEMRNHRREQAYRLADAEARRKAIREAAGWKGNVTVRAYADGGDAVLEVRDDGIGMAEEVRRNCTATHFSTKRDNALYEGLNAGTGLGLSFVTSVLEQHGATLEVESQPLRGTTVRVRMKRDRGQADS